MLKKSNVFRCGGLQLLNPSPPSLPSSSRPPAATWGISHQYQFPSQSCRTYGTAQDMPHKDLSWPAVTPFTPYDIFKQKRGAPYSKTHFYDLVKIYHPDRPCNGHPLCKDISPEVRLHRYRLIIAAHEILSDPVKRAAYDEFGTGWNYLTGASHNPTTPSWGRADMSYNHGPVYANATWEDWEAFNNKNHGKQRNSVDPNTFTTLIILLALFGGAVQLSMIGKYSTGYEQRIRELNEKSSRFLTGRQQDTVDQTTSAESKVKQFLIRRDPSGFGLREEEQAVYKEVFQRDSVTVAGAEGAKNNATDKVTHAVRPAEEP